MTRNNDRAAELRDAVGPPQRVRREEPYRLGGIARMHAKVLNAPPLEWARSIHTQWSAGDLRPRNVPIDAEKIRKSVKAELVEEALKSAARGENELRFKALIRAIRLLTASQDASDQKKLLDLTRFLTGVWGVTKAAAAVGGSDHDAVQELREKWGDAQLPPEGAMVGPWSADYLLVEAAVRRLG